MGVKPGTPRSKRAGRKPGTPNKKTLALIEILEGQNFDPVTEALHVYTLALEHFDKNRSDFRFKYLEIAQKGVQDLMRFVYPQRKAIDVTSGDMPINPGTLAHIPKEDLESIRSILKKSSPEEE